MTTVMSGHIVVDDKNVARIARSRIKVIHLVMEKMANKWDAEELQRNFPHLSLGQVYAALAYYHDHRAECDAQIEASIKLADEMREKAGPSPVAARLRAEGKIP